MSVSVAVFASGGGSNFQSLLDHQSDESPGRIDLLISDRPEAGALERAEKAGVATRIIPVKGRPLDGVALETLEVLEEFGIQVILLAGYLRLIPPVGGPGFPQPDPEYPSGPSSCLRGEGDVGASCPRGCSGFRGHFFRPHDPLRGRGVRYRGHPGPVARAGPGEDTPDSSGGPGSEGRAHPLSPGRRPSLSGGGSGE